jgi:hypothetical protein
MWIPLTMEKEPAKEKDDQSENFEKQAINYKKSHDSKC